MHEIIKNFGNRKYLLKRIAITGSSQLLVQLLGFIGGIFIIRTLPLEEYAWYVLANTTLGIITVLGDGGISQGVITEGGKVWQDKEKLGEVLSTGLGLRRRFAMISVALSTPLLFYLLRENNASWTTAVIISLSLIPAFYSSLSDILLQVVPKLHNNIGELQRNQIEVSFLRLIFLVTSLLLIPLTYIAILCNGLSRMYGNIRLKKIAEKNIYLEAEENLEVRKNILYMVKRILPGSIYYALSGQLVIWLISIFGKTVEIAQIGALMRYTILFGLFSTIISTVIVPDFSKLREHGDYIRKRYISYLAFLFALILIILLLVFVFSDTFLWALGDNYSGLKKEFILVMLAAGLKFLSGSMFSIGAARGWPTPPSLLIPINISFVILGVLCYDMSILREVILFDIVVSLVPTLVHVSYFIKRVRKYE